MANIGWVYGVLRHKHDIDTDGMTPEEAFEKLRELERKDYAKSKKIVELPKEEYAGLCSAIRTKYADKIPKKDYILYKDSCYVYNYDKDAERLVCVNKIDIIGNEERIKSIMEVLRNV